MTEESLLVPETGQDPVTPEANSGGRKVFIKTHGCQMNEYDSSRMLDLLKDSEDAVLVDSPEQADILLLNTCSIREKAQEKVFHQLGRWRSLKADNPNLRIAVGGCVASQEGAAIGKRAPYVDVVFGPQTLHKLPEMLQESRAGETVVDISFPEIEKFDRLPEPQVDSCQAFLTIMEGCSKYCSFCVVPYTRGEEVSRPLDDVLAEAVHLADQGVREINLLGQNVNAYRGLNHEGKLVDLALLINFIASIEGIDRIRFTTSHPVEFNQNLVTAYDQVPELVSHLHLPVQSGSDRILAAMKLDRKAVGRVLDRLHHARLSANNDPAGSDVVVIAVAGVFSANLWRFGAIAPTGIVAAIGAGTHHSRHRAAAGSSRRSARRAYACKRGGIGVGCQHRRICILTNDHQLVARVGPLWAIGADAKRRGHVVLGQLLYNQCPSMQSPTVVG